MTGAAIRQFPAGQAKPARPCRVLYLGPAADELCELLASQIGRVDISYHADVQSALTAARQQTFDVVLVDQRDSSLASKLILPLVSGLGYPVKLVVVSPFADVSHYLAVPGVARVLAAPLREGQLLRVLGLERRAPRGTPEEKPEEKPKAPTQKSLVQRLSDRFMAMVSTAYKRAAFTLLFVLFVTFAFYGVLIGYFLLSGSWGAPMTLSRGHELVNKAERDITEMRVALNQTEQKLTDAQLALETAQHKLEDARAQVKSAKGTLKREIVLRKKLVSLGGRNISRLEKVRGSLSRQLSKSGLNKNLEELYDKRLINRKEFTNNALGMIEAEQRLAAVENEIETMRSERETSAGAVELLQIILEGLEAGSAVMAPSAAPPDLLLLVKQAVEARTAEQQALSEIDAAQQNIKQLGSNRTVLTQQIAAVELSAPGRAIYARVDVVFVPYTNTKQFSDGDKLYSCLFTILWCKEAGRVGAMLPGEINAVHPFFGKPIRGIFVEASSMTPGAAAREIIHGSRAPFFF